MTKRDALMLLFIVTALTFWAFRTHANTQHNHAPETRYLQTPRNPYPGNLVPYQNRNRPPFRNYNPNLILKQPKPLN